MATFKHVGDVITIDDVEISVDLFRALEPNYRPHPDLEMLVYKDGTLTTRMNGKTASYGGWTEGERYIARKEDFRTIVRIAQREDGETNQTVESIAYPELCRERDYPQIKDLVIALWEHIVEKKDTVESGIDSLQTQRVDVKNKYPLKEDTEDGSNNLKGSTETVLPKGTRRTRNRSKHSG
jgi:hypothetical protein